LEEHEAAEADFAEVLVLSRKTYAAEFSAAAQWGLATTAFLKGRFDVAKERLERLTADMSEEIMVTGWAGTNFVHWLVTGALCCVLERDMDALRRMLAKAGDPRLSRSLESMDYWADVLQGITGFLHRERDRSLAAFRQAVQRAEARIIPGPTLLIALLCGSALRAVGQDQEARGYLERAREIARNGGMKTWSSILPAMEDRIVKAFRHLLESE
jgi:tetratricopeptide (TPR) repeat protein